MITADISAAHVVAFCRSISAEAAFYVSVEPRPGFEPGNCFNNIDAMVEERGGKSIYGWNIAEWPSVFLEAEQHAVWQRPDGSFVDPTPPIQPFSKIAFLPDPTLGDWEFRPNVKLALLQDRAVNDFLEETRLAQREVKRNGCVSAPLARRIRALQRRLTEKYGTEPLPKHGL